jgi:hypothetical protein
MRHVAAIAAAGVFLFLLTFLASTPTSTAVPVNAQEPAATCPATPDLAAFETQIAAKIYATLTASAPTSTPVVLPTATSTRLPNAPVQQDVPVTIGKWEVTLLSARRDKTIWGPNDSQTASGVWATLIFRIRNLQTETDFLYRSDRPQVWTDLTEKSKPIQLSYDLESRAKWFYSCCDDILDDVNPGQERVILTVFDVPEKSQMLHLEFFDTAWLAPVFIVPNFIGIPPRPAN